MNGMADNGLRSISFCCISTGEFRFPNKDDAKIALRTVYSFLQQNNNTVDRIVFNVFKDMDREIYEKLLTDEILNL